MTLAEFNACLERRGVASHVRLDQLVALPTRPTTAIGKIHKKAIVRDVG